MSGCPPCKIIIITTGGARAVGGASILTKLDPKTGKNRYMPQEEAASLGAGDDTRTSGPHCRCPPPERTRA
jgi:hypothetical protein